MNKAISMIVAALALAACGQSARLGSLGRNDTVVTNLAPAYAYVDGATNDLAASIGPGDIISDGTNTIDAARTVYSLSYMPWYVYSVGETAYSPPVACDYRASIETDQGTVSDGWLSRSKVNGSYVYIRVSARDCYYLFDPQDGVYPVGSGDSITVGSQTNIIELGAVECDIRRASEFGPVPVGKLAMTNELPNVPSWAMAADKPTYTAGEVGAATHGDATNAATWAANRAAVAATNYTDAATNALAQTIQQGGGAPEWQEVNYDVELDTVNYVTNGIASLTFVAAGYAYDLMVSTNGWPEGAAMFVRGSLRAGATYRVPNKLRLIGYGTWPTNDFQSVWWRSGTNIFVNVLIEE